MHVQTWAGLILWGCQQLGPVFPSEIDLQLRRERRVCKYGWLFFIVSFVTNIYCWPGRFKRLVHIHVSHPVSSISSYFKFKDELKYEVHVQIYVLLALQYIIYLA